MRALPQATLAVLPQIPLVQQETSTLSSNGMEYITKLVYEDAYQKITLSLNEWGQITNRDVKTLD